MNTSETTTMDNNTLLQVQDVGVAYYLKGKNLFRPKKFQALKNITFDLHEGDSVGIVGNNGAGKSTLLRLIAGIFEPDEGQILFADPSVRASLLSFDLAFFPHLSGRENAILGGMLQGHSRDQMLNNMDEIKAFSELGDFFEQPLMTYSQGMKARLAFSVAFQIRPDILLVDEILGVGDAKFQEKSSSLMQERIKSHHSTVIIVSHRPRIIETICNRVIWIENGEIVMTGSTKDVLKEYASTTNKTN